MRSRRKWLLCIVAAVLVPLVGLNVYWAMQPKPEPGISLENFRLVQKGMTMDQVEGLMDQRANSTDTGISYWNSSWRSSVIAGDVSVAIHFDDQGVVDAGLFTRFAPNPSYGTSTIVFTEPLGTWEKVRWRFFQWTGW